MEVNYETIRHWLDNIHDSYDTLFQLDDDTVSNSQHDEIDKSLSKLDEMIDHLEYLCEKTPLDERKAFEGYHAGLKAPNTPVTIATIKTSLRIDPYSKMNFLEPELSKENLVTLAQIAFDYANQQGLEGYAVRSLNFNGDGLGTELTVNCMRMD